MGIAARAPFPPLISRAARALWWCGMPLVVLGLVLFGHEVYPPDAVYDAANSLSTASPLAAELIAHYLLSLVAILLLASVTLWSHRRRTATVQLESVALVTFVAGLEACTRLSWFLRCRGLGNPISLSEFHKDLHVAATASLVVMTAPVLVGAILVRTCPGGLSGSPSRRSLLSLLAAATSVMLIWLLYDVLLEGPPGAMT